MELAVKQEQSPAPYKIFPIGYDRETLDVIKSLHCKDLTDKEFCVFIKVCKQRNLDPLLKQIYAIKRPNSQTGKSEMTIQVSIDGQRLVAERTGRYAPGREPTYQYDEKGKLISATAYVKKQSSDGTWHEVAATAFYDEYVVLTKEKRPTYFWATKGRGQLAKCAEALALRRSFPNDLSGMYTAEEMEQADNPIIIETEITEQESTSKEVETISQAQYEELAKIFEECDPTYVTRIIGWLRSKKVNNVIDMPPRLYESVRNYALANREEYKATKAAIVVDEEQAEEEPLMWM